jgi:hypothetical protein
MALTLESIANDIYERMAGYTHSAHPTDDEVTIAWLVCELKATKDPAPSGQAELPGYTDTQLLDFIQGLNDAARYTGKCVLRMSNTGRGFRLHETSRGDACDNVRQAIINLMRESV